MHQKYPIRPSVRASILLFRRPIDIKIPKQRSLDEAQLRPLPQNVAVGQVEDRVAGFHAPQPMGRIEPRNPYAFRNPEQQGILGDELIQQDGIPPGTLIGVESDHRGNLLEELGQLQLISRESILEEELLMSRYEVGHDGEISRNQEYHENYSLAIDEYQCAEEHHPPEESEIPPGEDIVEENGQEQYGSRSRQQNLRFSPIPKRITVPPEEKASPEDRDQHLQSEHEPDVAIITAAKLTRTQPGVFE